MLRPYTPPRLDKPTLERLVPGGPLLVCSAGPYRLRGRPLLFGLPLAVVMAARHGREVIPVPAAAAHVAGVMVFGERAISVVDVAPLLGLPPAHPARRQLVVFHGAAGPAALSVETALRTERPRHWAPPALLAPLQSAAIAGAVPRPNGWLAILDPESLPSAVPAAPEAA